MVENIEYRITEEYLNIRKKKKLSIKKKIKEIFFTYWILPLGK